MVSMNLLGIVVPWCGLWIRRPRRFWPGLARRCRLLPSHHFSFRVGTKYAGDFDLQLFPNMVSGTFNV